MGYIIIKKKNNKKMSKIKITESKLKQIVNESVKKVLKEGKVKKTPESINIDGVDYEKTDVKGGGMLHPGFRWKDHETHNPEKSKLFRKRKDGYRYAQSYDGNPRWIHNQLTTESSTVKKVLRESDEFKPHGYKGTSNWGGNEIQLSDRGDEARIRNSHTGEISDWMEIQFDEDGVAYVTDENGNEERLCDYLRY